MSVTMRIVQQYEFRHEKEFLALEKMFAQLEAARPDLPKGKRMKPLSADEPCNSLVWQAEFPDLNAAHKALQAFAGDPTHEELLARQSPFFVQMKIEFYENL